MNRKNNNNTITTTSKAIDVKKTIITKNEKRIKVL
jgi:hypothetical protein